METLDAAVLRGWASGAVGYLQAHRGELDALNVFPVADADTGTNLYLTLWEAAQSVGHLPPDAPTRDVARALARGALVGARGNSGVIVSQYLGALLQRVTGDAVTAEALVVALRQATQAAYRAVAHPVEGTVLTVARAVGDGARAALATADDVRDILERGIDAGYVALARTTAQLAPLRAAGVLDAGAWGLLLILDALAESLAGPGGRPPSALRRPQVEVGEPHAGTPAEVEHGAGEFEVMYLVAVDGPGAGDLSTTLRDGLATVGDSVAVVGGEGLWQAHVHTDHPLRALEVGAGLGGGPTQVRVRHLASQTGVHGSQRPTLGLVTVTAAPGLVADLARAGAVVVLVLPGQTAGPELDRAIDDTGARTVLLLAADACLREAERPSHVEVLAGLSEVQVVVGAATLASFEASVGRRGLLAEVVRAVGGVRTATVGDRVGPLEDADAVAEAAVSLLGEDSTLLTVVTSAQTPPRAVERLCSVVADRFGHVEVVVLDGAAPGERVVLGVE